MVSMPAERCSANVRETVRLSTVPCSPESCHVPCTIRDTDSEPPQIDERGTSARAVMRQRCDFTASCSLLDLLELSCYYH